MCKIPWPMTICCYPSWQHPHSALSQYTLLELLDVLSLCVVSEISDAPMVAEMSDTFISNKPLDLL